MSGHLFLQFNTFSKNRFGGNPCVVLFSDDRLDDETMLTIAGNVNSTEIVFINHSNVASCSIRCFNFYEEIPFSVHLTMAAAAALVESKWLTLKANRNSILIESKVGVIPVEIYIQGDTIYKIAIFLENSKFLSIYQPAEVLPIFGLAVQDLISPIPIQIVSAGSPVLMIPLKDINALNKIQISRSAYERLCSVSHFSSVHFFCIESDAQNERTVARHFKPFANQRYRGSQDSRESHFSGSATVAMAAYLWHYKLLVNSTFTATQGHWMNRPSQAIVELLGLSDNVKSIKITGDVLTTVRGTFL